MKKILIYMLLPYLAGSNVVCKNTDVSTQCPSTSTCKAAPKKQKRKPKCSTATCANPDQENTKKETAKKQQQSTTILNHHDLIEIKSEQLFETLNSIQLQVPVVIKAGATWCPPCQRSIEPFQNLANKYQPGVDAVFCTLTVENRPALSPDSLLSSLAHQFDLKFKSIPVFVILYKNEKHVIHGSDQIPAIKTTLEKLQKKHPRLPSITENSLDAVNAASKKKPVIIKIHAFWCPPCSAMESVFENVADQFKKQAKFLRLDSVQNPELTQKIMEENDLKGLPAFVFIKDGNVIKTLMGAMAEEDFAKELKNIL